MCVCVFLEGYPFKQQLPNKRLLSHEHPLGVWVEHVDPRQPGSQGSARAKMPCSHHQKNALFGFIFLFLGVPLFSNQAKKMVFCRGPNSSLVHFDWTWQSPYLGVRPRWPNTQAPTSHCLTCCRWSKTNPAVFQGCFKSPE